MADPDTVTYTSKSVLRWGGLSLLASSLCLVVFILLVGITKQTLPIPAVEALEVPMGPMALFLIAVVGELLLLPGGLALYVWLESDHKAAAMFATAFWSLAVTLFMVSRGQLFSLWMLSERYIDAAGTPDQWVITASAEQALAVQNVYATMALTLLSVASVLYGSLMVKGSEDRLIGWVAIVAGILSLYAPFAVVMEVPPAISLAGLMFGAVWQLSAGFKLFRSGADG